MAKSKAEVNFMEHLKPLLPAGGDASELETATQALAGLSPEDRNLLAAVQESPFRLTTLEQFREFPANTEYFILEPNIRKVEDVGWRYLAQHLDVLLPRRCWTLLIPFPSAIMPCRRNRAALRAEAISLSPATSGNMSAPGRCRRKKALHQRTAGTEPEGMCQPEQGAAPSGKACAGAIRRCRYAPL